VSLQLFSDACFEEVIYSKKTFEDFLANEAYQLFVFNSDYFFVTLSIYAISFYKLYNENRLKQQIIAGTANAKFESLKPNRSFFYSTA
jgi:hypothetical protein